MLNISLKIKSISQSHINEVPTNFLQYFFNNNLLHKCAYYSEFKVQILQVINTYLKNLATIYKLKLNIKKESKLVKLSILKGPFIHAKSRLTFKLANNQLLLGLVYRLPTFNKNLNTLIYTTNYLKFLTNYTSSISKHCIFYKYFNKPNYFRVIYKG